MDPDHVKQVVWELCAGAGVLALLALLAAAFGRRRRAPGAVASGGVALTLSLLVAIAALGVASGLAPGTGQRGCALALALGFLVAPLGAFAGGLCSDPGDRPEVPPPPAWSLLPGLVVTGTALCAMGWLEGHYGIRCRHQLDFWNLGVASGLVLCVLVLRAGNAWGAAEALCGSLSGASLLVLTLGWSVEIAVAHFSEAPTAPWFVMFCGVAILAGWTMALVVSAMTTGGNGNLTATLVSAVVMAVAVGGVASSVSVNIVHEYNIVPAMSAGFVAALLLLSFTVGERGAFPDNVTAVTAMLVLTGLAWVGFKLMAGLGVAVVAVGFLAVWPAATALGVAAPSRLGMPVAQRFITLAGSFLALLTAFKVFAHVTDLRSVGIDLTDGNTLAAMIVALGFPIVLESLFGRCPLCCVENRDGAPSGSANDASPAIRTRGAVAIFFRAFARLVIVFGAAFIAVVCLALFAGTGGVASLVLGAAVWGMLSASSVASTGEEGGLLSFRGMPAALLMACVALVATPWKDALIDVTRAQKLHVIFGLGGVAVLGTLLASLRIRHAQDAGLPSCSTATSPVSAAAASSAGVSPACLADALRIPAPPVPLPPSPSRQDASVPPDPPPPPV